MPGYVYFIRNPENGLIKIGCTKNLLSRLKSIGGEFLCAISTEQHFALERELHQKFSARNVRGEWFAIEETDMTEVACGQTVLGPEEFPDLPTVRKVRPGVSLNVFVYKELHRALQDYIRSCRPRPMISNVLRVAIEDYLSQKGFWPPQGDAD